MSLASLEPVKGWMQATHRGDDLWVQAEASTVVELCCDRCLKAFHRLAVAVEESIALQLDDDSLDPELQLENAAGDPVMDQLDPWDALILSTGCLSSSTCSYRSNGSAAPIALVF